MRLARRDCLTAASIPGVADRAVPTMMGARLSAWSTAAAVAAPFNIGLGVGFLVTRHAWKVSPNRRCLASCPRRTCSARTQSTAEIGDFASLGGGPCSTLTR